MVIVLEVQEALTPAGKPLAALIPLPEIPVAPVVKCIIFVKAVLIHIVGVEDALPTVFIDFTIVAMDEVADAAVQLFELE